MPQTNQPGQRWAILGGTFDPVHIGHLRIAIQLRDAGFERVLLIPNRVPPHRPAPQASSSQRLAMLELATAGLDGIDVCAIELERADYSYSVTTLEQLTQQHPDVAFSWVMGMDAWLGFDRWHRAEDILTMANLLVISRPGEHPQEPTWQQNRRPKQATISDLLASKAGMVCIQHWPGLDVSATDLRRALRQGDNVTFLVPDSVRDYLNQHQLYR